jgi:hypothetical protein
MALFGIVSGSGFTGAAQFISGSTYEGISLGTLTSGSKYDLSFDYISSAPLNVYSGDYSDKFIVTQYPSSAIAINTGSIKSWSGEFLAVYDKENFLGLGSDGWFAVDKLRVKPIPNLATVTFTNNSTYSYEAFTGASAQGFTAVETSGRGIAYGAFAFQSGKRYRFVYKLDVNAINAGQGIQLLIAPSTAISSVYLVNTHTTTDGTGSFIKNIDYTVPASGMTHYGFRVENGQTADFVVSGFHFYEIPEWTSTGNHTQNLSILDKSGATGQSMLISASGAGDSTTNYVVLPSANIESCVSGKKYTLEGFARSDTASRTITAVIGTKTVTSATLSTTAGTFTKFVLNLLWESADVTAGQDLKLYISGAGSVYVDKLSLTQRFDMWICGKEKHTQGTRNLVAILSTETASGVYAYPTIMFGLSAYAYPNSISNFTKENLTRSSNGSYPENTWNNFGVLSSFPNSKNYINGVENGTADTSLWGKQLATIALTIARRAFNAQYEFQGLISHLQIIRFDNISLSTFNSAITGLQYPTGGGSEEVLRQDWSMVSGNIAYDQSPKANNLTGYGTINAASNVITTKDYVIQPDKLIQATDVSRPLYVSDSYWEFDGTNDFLYPTGSLGLIKEYYIKFKPDALDVTKSLANFNVTSSLFMSSSNSMFMTGSTFATMSLYSSSLATVPNVISSDWNILHASDAIGVEANQFKLGFATTYWDGAIQRFVAYDRQLSDNDKNRLLRSLSF